MSKKLKILLSVVILFVVVIVSTITIISSKINPELIRTVAIEAIEENLPGAKVKIEKIDYGIGTSVTLNVDKVLFTQKSNKSKLLELEKIAVKIPLLAILTSGGTIDILTDSPKVFVRKRGEKLNWLEALGEKTKKEPESPEKKKTESESKEVELPSFITKSKVNFRVSNLVLALDMGKNQKSSFKVSKVLVKNLNLDKSTAFEVTSELKHQMDAGKFFKTKAQIIGEIYLKELIEKGELKTSTTLSVTDTSLDGLDMKIPNVKGNVKANGKFDNINADLSVNIDNLISLASTANYTGNKVNVSKLDLQIAPEESFKYLPGDLKSQLNMVNLAGVKIKLSGTTSVNLDTMKIKPNLSISTIKKIGLNLGEGLNLQTTIEGALKGQKVNLKVNNEAFQGMISAQVDTVFDPMNIPAELHKFKPINVRVSMANLKVTKDFIQKTLYGGKTTEEKKEETTPQQVDTTPGTKIKLPKVNISLSGKHIFIGKEEVSLDGKVFVHLNKVNSPGVSLRYGPGVMKVDFNTLIKDTKNINNKFNVNFGKVQVEAFNAFFPPFIKNVKGVFDGKVNGNVNLAKALNYSVNANLNGKNGDLKDLDLERFAKSLLEGALKGKVDPKKLHIDNKFDSLAVKVRATEKRVDLDTFNMVGHQRSSIIKSSGKVALDGRASKVKGTFYSKASEPQMKKDFSRSDVPFLFEGKGFVLLPNLGYTAGEMAKGALKAETKKQKKKIEAAAKKEAEKLKNKAAEELKKKAKDLFKGFKL